MPISNAENRLGVAMTRMKRVQAYLYVLRDEVEQYRRYGELTQAKYREILQQLSAVEELFTKLVQRKSPDRPA